jgi:RNA polymerase sigma-70 factor (ECF subfamily)
MAAPHLTADVLGDIFAEHGDALTRWFARRTFDAETAFDLTAETFAQAVAGRNRFAGGTDREVLAWIYGIARNQLHTFFRRGAVELRAMQRLGLERPPLSDADLQRIVDEADLQELRHIVHSSLVELPEHHREAVRLRIIEDCSYSEAAAQLHISEQTARAHVSRGLRRLWELVPASALATINEGLS